MIGSIDQAMLEKLIDFYNHNEDQEICIVLNTQGGSFFYSETIIEILNRHNNTSIIIQGAYSAGMKICLDTTCKKILSKSARGMWHFGRWDINFTDQLKPYYDEDKCIIKNMPIHNKFSKAVSKKIMTATEYKEFEKGNDVYFDFKRMKQIFPNAKTLK